jgi:hypothetical protein
MVRIREVLNSREKDLIEEYQLAILRADVEELEMVNMYHKLIYEVIVKANKRYYTENPIVIPIKTGKVHKDKTNKSNRTVYDLFTDEEVEEVDFLKWRMTKSLFPWTRRRNEKKINSIIETAKNRAGVKNT